MNASTFPTSDEIAEQVKQTQRRQVSDLRKLISSTLHRMGVSGVRHARVEVASSVPTKALREELLAHGWQVNEDVNGEIRTIYIRLPEKA